MHPPKRRWPVVREVLRTKTVRVELRQKANGAARIVVHVKDAGARDAIIDAIKDGLAKSHPGSA